MPTQASELEAAWHALSVDEVVTKLATSRTGLSENEAKRRLQHFGFNELEPEKKTSPLGILLRQFKNILILILNSERPLFASWHVPGSSPPVFALY